jgi:hypothetical protein
LCAMFHNVAKIQEDIGANSMIFWEKKCFKNWIKKIFKHHHISTDGSSR